MFIRVRKVYACKIICMFYVFVCMYICMHKCLCFLVCVYECVCIAAVAWTTESIFVFVQGCMLVVL